MTATLRPIKVTNEMAKFELADQATTHRDVRPSVRRGREPRIRLGLSAGLNRRLARALADYERQHSDKAHENKHGRIREDRTTDNEYPECCMHDCPAEKKTGTHSA